jgi:hypothetical protein
MTEKIITIRVSPVRRYQVTVHTQGADEGLNGVESYAIGVTGRDIAIMANALAGEAERLNPSFKVKIEGLGLSEREESYWDAVKGQGRNG